jgi:flagellar biosynthesis protein FlhG
MGYAVMILDANSSLNNAQTALGTICPFHLGHFLNGDKSLREIILKRRYGINLIAGASTIEAMTTLNPSKASRVLKQFGDMESELDFLIVDMPPGTEQSVLSFMASTSRRIIVVRNDQAGVTDA